MIICFACPPSTRQLLDELVAKGDYADYSQVIAVAIQNLALLHEALPTASGALVIGDSSDDTSRKGTAVARETTLLRTRQTARPTKAARKPTPLNRVQPATKSPPSLFKLDGLAEEKPPILAKIPSDSWMISDEVPIDRWMFGQYNKLLPAKASCRALAHLLQKGKKKGLDLDDSAQHIAKEAAVLGDYLAALDSREGHPRGEARSTAFPTTGDKAAKSRMRYANQFVGSVSKQGQLSGLLVSLKLVNWLRGSTRRLSLTQPGWDFALLPNPIFDSMRLDVPQRLSEDELEFLLRHVAENVPAERHAYTLVLKLVLSGVSAPRELDTALEHLASKALTEAFLSTQRSGVISRMADLDLLIRKREGVKVKYVVTHRGNDFLAGIDKEQ